jgi:hypothetical protein
MFVFRSTCILIRKERGNPMTQTPYESRHRRVRRTLAAGALCFAIASIGACAASRAAAPRATTPTAATWQLHTPDLPNLSDPTVRAQFVQSFADGYFSRPQRSSSNGTGKR